MYCAPIHRSASCLGVAALAVMNIPADSGTSDSPLYTLGRGVLSQKMIFTIKNISLVTLLMQAGHNWQSNIFPCKLF